MALRGISKVQCHDKLKAVCGLQFLPMWWATI
jgi:hypothetical protein